MGSFKDVKGGAYNVRIKADRVTEMVKRYFGVDVDLAKLSSSGLCYEDGYVYFIGQRQPWQAAGVAVAKSAKDLGNGEFEIEFEVYTPKGTYDASDESLYSSSASDLAKKFGVKDPIATGKARIKKAGNNEYTGGWVLVSYESKQKK